MYTRHAICFPVASAVESSNFFCLEFHGLDDLEAATLLIPVLALFTLLINLHPEASYLSWSYWTCHFAYERNF